VVAVVAAAAVDVGVVVVVAVAVVVAAAAAVVAGRTTVVRAIRGGRCWQRCSVVEEEASEELFPECLHFPRCSLRVPIINFHGSPDPVKRYQRIVLWLRQESGLPMFYASRSLFPE